MGEAKASFKSA